MLTAPASWVSERPPGAARTTDNTCRPRDNDSRVPELCCAERNSRCICICRCYCKWTNLNNLIFWLARSVDGVVPFGVPVVPGDAGFLQLPHLLVADLLADRVAAGVVAGGDGQAGAGGGRADEFQDGLVAGQGLAPPVDGDEGE